MSVWARYILLGLIAGFALSATNDEVAAAATPLAVGALSWSTVNDTVMGGRSRAKVGVTEGGTVSWSGYLSLENNGGFSSIRSQPTRYDWSAYDGVEVVVEGQGREIQVSLQRGDMVVRAGGYRASVSTEKSGETRVIIPFAAFQLKRFGRAINGPALKTGLKSIGQLGLLLADKRQGPFSITLRAFRPVNIPKASQLNAALAPLLVAAIERGVPIFNGGDAAGCAAIYRDVLTRAMRDRMLGTQSWSERLVSTALANAAKQSAVDAAWTLRRAMDRLLQTISNR